MNSLRVFWTDLDNNAAIERAGELLGLYDPNARLGLAIRFYTNVARQHEDGVLALHVEDLDLRHLARLARWPGDARLLYEAFSQGGVLCSPAAAPEEHGRCGLRPPTRHGQQLPHATGAVAVHEWDRRMGRWIRRGREEAERRKGVRSRARLRPTAPASVGNGTGGRSTPFISLDGPARTAPESVPSEPDLPRHRTDAGAGQGIREPETPPGKGVSGTRGGGATDVSRGGGGGAANVDKGVTSAALPRRNQHVVAKPCPAGGGETPPASPAPAPPPDGGRGGRHVSGEKGKAPPPVGAGGPEALPPTPPGAVESVAVLAARVMAGGARLDTPSRWDRALADYMATSSTKGLRLEEARALFVQANGERPAEGGSRGR